MSTLSLFQLLPQHVVRLVVEHVVGGSRLVYAGLPPYSKNFWRLISPLLRVCHDLRVVARSHYCRCFVLDLTIQYLLPDQPEIGYRTYNYLGYATHHLATYLSIGLSEKNIYSGEALERLSQIPYDGRAFPRVRTLKFIIYPGGISDMSEDMEIDALVVEANIRAFVRRIREIAPALNEIHVGLENSADVPEFPSQHFGGLAPQLFRLANRIGYGDAAITPVLVPLQLNSICHLSSIKSDVEITSSQFIRLARQNAQTLQSLVLATDHGAPISSLIQNDDGSYVMYPQLVTLKLSWWPSPDYQRRPAFGSGVVPFPSLQRVELPSYYPFGDDTLFRGNAATLERLTMKLEAPTVAMLRRYNVFTLASHPKLWYVRISYYDRLIPGAFATIDESVSFSLGIGRAASVRELSGAANIDKPATTLTQLGNHANIQILSLVRIRLDLWDVIALIKSLPLLTDLHSSHPHVGAIPAGITHDELPAYLHSNYSPVGERFRCWHFYNQMINYYAEISKCVLLLALVCPSLDYAAFHGCKSQDFVEYMERAVDSDMFKQYAPRLRRLLL